MMRRVLAALAITLSFLSCAGAAHAASGDWYSRTNPLRISDGGYVRAAGYGAFFNYQGQDAMSTSWSKDKLPGGHGVTVKTTFWFYGDYAGSNGWHALSSQQTPDYFSTSFKEQANNHNLQGWGSNARGRMNLCENRSLAPDVCSADIFRSFGY